MQADRADADRDRRLPRPALAGAERFRPRPHDRAARLFELKPLPGPMQFDLVEHPFWHDAGLISAPARPGHGADPLPGVLERYRV